MAFEELTSELILDASEHEAGISNAVDASTEFEDATAGVEQQLFDLDTAGVAAGAGIAAVGGAITGVVEDTKAWRESLGRTRSTMGLTKEETNGLARSISNATFPMDDAVGTMDALARQGVETEEEMENVATAADMFADATGTSATTVAENAVPALRAMGGEAGDLEENMDAFTFVARNSTMSVEDFSRVVQKTGPEIEKMGLSVDDTATILTALEEKGLDSRTAMREFRQAARDADGDQQALMETLGLTEEELGAQQQALAEAEGATKAHAEAANESVTTMDRLRHGFDEAKLAAGGLLDPVEAAGPALMGLGGALSTVSAINFGAVIPSLAGVMTTISPLLPLIIGLGAAAGVLYKAWDSNFLGVQNVTRDVFDALGGMVDWLGEKFDSGVSWIMEKVLAIPDGIAAVIDKIPGIDSEDVLGEIDTDGIMDSLFPPKPGEKGEEVGEEAGVGMSEGMQSSAPGADSVVSQRKDELRPDTSRPTAGGATAETPNVSSKAGGGPSPEELDRPSSQSTGTGGLSADDLAAAIQNALDGLGLTTTLRSDDPTLDRVIKDEARTVFQNEGKKEAKRADLRGIKT
jgi:TP901 family phage tail tape measure protein